MNEEGNKLDLQPRFFREGAPYFGAYEKILSELVINQKDSASYMVPVTQDLMRNIHDHLAYCQVILGKAERLVEEARSKNVRPNEIEKIVDICRDMQKLQTKLVDSVNDCVNSIMDNVFPR